MEKSKKSDNDTKIIQAPTKRPHDEDDDNDLTNEIPLNKIVKSENSSQSTATAAASPSAEIASAADTKSCIISSPVDILTLHQRKSDSNTSFTLGNKIEAQDFNGTWHTAKVVEVDSDEREVLIRFEKPKKGKGGGAEEWIPMNSSRLRQITSRNNKKIISVFDVGEKCMAKWSGPRKFPATVTKILGNDTYEVLFDDGYMKSIKSYNLTKIKQKTTPKKSPATTPTKPKSPAKKDWPLIPINSINLEELNLPDIPKDGEWCCHWVNDQPIGKEGFLAVGDHKKSTIIVEDWRLPPNWVKHMYQRSNILGKWDVILVNSQGKRFRSKADLKQYIEELGQVYNPDIYDFSIHRRRAKDIGAYVFTKDYKPPPPPASHSQQNLSSLQEKKSENTEKTSRQISTPSSSSLEPSSATKDENVITNKLPKEEKPTVEDGYVLVGSLKVQIIDNLFRCPQEGCNKNFRKENHLQIHVKHYHQELANLLGVCPNMQDLARKRTLGTASDSEPLPKNHLPNVQFFAKLHQQELASRTHRRSTLTPRTSSSTPDILLTPEQIKKEDQDASSTPVHVPETLIKLTDTENQLLTPTTSENKSILDSFTPQTNEPKQSNSATVAENNTLATPQSKSQAQEQKPTTIGKKIKKSSVKCSSAGSNRKSSRQKLTKKYIQSSTLTTQPITANNNNILNETNITHSDLEETRHSFNGNNSTSEITNSKALLTSSLLKKIKPEPLFIASDANLDATSQSQTTGSVQENSQSPQYINENGEIIKIVRMRQEEIINCLCSYGEEDGLMIQCELCLCWQHGICNGIEKESQVPEKYICYICRNPQRGRSSLKYIHDQDWMYEGKLPVANYHAPSPDLEERFEILRKTHILTGNLLELKRFMHSLKVKINIAENKDHPKMYLWTNKWETSPAKENNKKSEEELEVVNEKNLNDIKKTDDDDKNQNQDQNKDNEEKHDDDNEEKINKKNDNDDTKITDSELKNNENENDKKDEFEGNVYENLKKEKEESNKSAAGDGAAVAAAGDSNAVAVAGGGDAVVAAEPSDSVSAGGPSDVVAAAGPSDAVAAAAEPSDTVAAAGDGGAVSSSPASNVLKQPTIPQPEAPINPVECQRRLLEHIKNQQLRVMDRLQTFESQIMELESLDDSAIVTDEANDYSKTKELIAMYVKDLETMKNIAKINTIQIAQNFPVG